MFKLAVFTDEVSQEFSVAVELAQEFGLDGLEVRSVWDKPPHALENHDIRDMREALKGSKLEICSIAAPFFKCDLDSPTERKEHLDILKKCCELADIFDCGIVRGFTFWRKGDPADQWDQMVKAFDEPLEILERYDKVLAIENEASTMIGDGITLARLLDELDTPRIGAMWDPANNLWDASGETPYPDGYEAIKNRMPHMHIKDSRISPETGEAECVPIGEGEVDIPGQFKALVDDGYEGFVSLETHWRPNALSEEELSLPGGSAFSESGEFATRICLNNLFEILKGLGLR